MSLFRPVLRAVCGAALRLAGWRLVYPPQPGPKAVVILYPHTSNWDFVLGMLAIGALGLPVNWAAKDSLFNSPLGGFFRALGGVPVNRRERTGFVGQMAEEFRRRERFTLALAPEGTRSRTEHWKSGFYRLAEVARVPIGLGYIDYRQRELGIARWLASCGDPAQDMAAIRTAYAGKTGRHPQLAGPIRLQDKMDG